MSDCSEKPLTIKELTSKAGKASVAKLTKEQLKARATKASHARACYKDLPKASHSGEILINDRVIECFVLEDGTRLINQTSMIKAIGKGKQSSKKRSATGQLPVFLDFKSLSPFMPDNILSYSTPIEFRKPTGGKAQGFKAELLPEVCDVYLKARDAGVLKANQQHIAIECDIVVRALSKVGLIALIDSSTGYEKERDRYELQKFLSKYIQEDFMPWTKRFPDVFFDLYKKMYGIPKEERCHSHVGCFINRMYNEMGEGVLEELKKVNPIEENGKRKSKLHQHLTENSGVKLLDKKILQTITLMRIADNKNDFDKLYEKLTLTEER